MKSCSNLLVALIVLANTAFAAALTNADVIKMAKANLETSIIVTAVQNSSGEFDTSSDGLIALSTAGVPKEVISAMITRNSAPPSSAREAATTAPSNAAETPAQMSPSEVYMIEGDARHAMRYLSPQVRTAARGLGFGGVASYAVLRGRKANYRTKTRQPSFLVSVPDQAQPESYLTVASFAVRSNNSREVMIGGGFMSYSTGIHPDRVIATNSEKAADQTLAEKGFTIYKVTPKSPLPLGEYAVILYTGEMHALLGPWFSGTGNSYFDFGVDQD